MSKPEKTVKVIGTFDVETMRRIKLMKSNHGRFCVKVSVLDKDSLRVSVSESFWLESTLLTVVRL